MHILRDILVGTWQLLLDASVYVLFGLVVGGLLKMFLSPTAVARHLGTGRFTSVLKAALLGIPLPLCSCGVLPAAAALRRQGANRGATTAFLISTPESGVDSIAISYALLDPLMTLARPLAAFASALAGGIVQNLIHAPEREAQARPDLRCAVDGCCDGVDCPPEEHRRHHTTAERVKEGARYAFTDLWGDLAGWFWVGMVLAGVITVLIPAQWFSGILGGGIGSMLAMLAVGIPLYICATASTPVAAALILKGVSPGAALVFLLVGPATNVTSLTVLTKILGRKGAAIYLVSIAACAVLAGLAVDAIYVGLGIRAAAVVGEASELVPVAVKWVGAIVLVGLSIKPIHAWLRRRWFRHAAPHPDCSCEGGCAKEPMQTQGVPEPSLVVLENAPPGRLKLAPQATHGGCGCHGDCASEPTRPVGHPTSRTP